MRERARERWSELEFEIMALRIPFSSNSSHHLLIVYYLPSTVPRAFYVHTISYNCPDILGEVDFITVPTFYVKRLTPGKVKGLTLAHLDGKDSSQVARMQLHYDASLNATQGLISQTQPGPQTVSSLTGIFTIQGLEVPA